MKSIIICFVVLIGARQSVFSQNQFRLLSETGKYLYDDAPNALSVLYDNKLLKPSEYDVTLKSGSVKKTDSCLWVIPNTPETYITIKNRKNDSTIKKSFLTIPLPQPDISIDGKLRGGKVSKYDLLAFKGLVAEIYNFDNPPIYHVDNLEVNLEIGREKIHFLCKGPLISDTIKYYVKRMRPFDKIEFFNFQLSPFRIVRNPIVIEIKEVSSLTEDYQTFT